MKPENPPTVLSELTRLNGISESCSQALRTMRRVKAPASEIARVEQEKASADREFNAISAMLRARGAK